MATRKTALYLNATILLCELVALVFSILHHGVSLFLYYTQICNLFALVGSSLYLIYTRKGKAPKWLRLVRYTNVVTLTITFLVVVVFLAPLICMREVFANGQPFGVGVWIAAKEMFFGGSVFFHHIVCPILTFVSFVYFEEGEEITKQESLYALIPTVAYAAVLILLNVLRVVEGPYPFLMVYEQGALLSCAWALVIFALAYLLGAVVWRMVRKKK
jgi:hypothetical protein